MAEHPTIQQLEELLSGQMPDPEADAVSAHLEADCEVCQERFATLLGLLAGPRSDEVVGEEAVSSATFDSMFDQVKAVVLEKHRSLTRARTRVKRRLPALREAQGVEDLVRCGLFRLDNWAYCEALLESCLAERFGNPRRMLFFAQLAQIRSTRLDPARYGRWAVADMQARTWAELANALRVTDSLPEAQDAMAKAELLSQQGSGDPLLAGRILVLSASLSGDRRKFNEAVENLNRAHAIFIRYGESQLAGRALVKKGLYLMYAQDLDRASEALRAGLAIIDAEEDPNLALAAYHNLVRLVMEKGQYQRARRELFRRRHLYLKTGDPLNLLKLRWLEAQIDAGLGKLERAEAGLAEVRASFRGLGKEYHAALAGLELAAVWVRQGQSERVPPLVDEIVAIFRSLGIAREATAALLVLHNAHEQGILSLRLVQQVAQFLRDLEHDPTARFEP